MIGALKYLILTLEVPFFFATIYPRCHGSRAVGGQNSRLPIHNCNLGGHAGISILRSD
jgi:hypothetical protein